MSLAVACEAAAPEKSLLRWRMKLNPPEPQRDWVLGPDHRGSPRGEVRRGSEGEFCPCAPLRPWQEFQLQGFGGEPVQRASCPPGRTPLAPKGYWISEPLLWEHGSGPKVKASLSGGPVIPADGSLWPLLHQGEGWGLC